jgi:hypothetical protein
MGKDEPPPFPQLVTLSLVGVSTAVIPLGILGIVNLIRVPNETLSILGWIFYVGLHASIVGLPIAAYLGYVQNRWGLKYKYGEESVLLIGTGLNLLVGLFGIVVWIFHWNHM